MTSPPTLDTLLIQARALYRARNDACAGLYGQVLARDPNHAEALDILARFAARDGRLQDALALRERLARARPRVAASHAALGQARLNAGDVAGGVAALRRALSLDPAHTVAVTHLGFLARRRRQPAEAVRWFARWHHLAPDDAEASKALSADLLDVNRPDAAAKALRTGVRHHPKDHELWFNLGRVLRRLNRLGNAADALRQAVRLKTTDPAAWFHLASVLRDMGQKEQGRQAFERLLAVAPDHTSGRLALGALLKEQGLWKQAAATLAPLAPPPGLTQGGVLLAMARLPMLYRSEAEMVRCRAAYARDLTRLATPPSVPTSQDTIARAADAVGASQPYYLPYQNQDDRPLQETYGRAVHAAMAAAHPAWCTPPETPPPAPGEPVRVGLVSGFFRWHTIWKLFLRGWMTGLDPARVRVTAYSTHPAVDDTTRTARQGFPRFVDHRPFQAMAQAIRDDRNHVLIWPEVGMDPMAARLACLRLAPVQCVSWGHPDTTGLPTMDWFLTSDLMEPDGAEKRYSERVHRLPNLGIAYPPLTVPTTAANFAALGIPDDATLILCCQYLSKYLPQHDRLLARIAARVPGARLAFIDIRRPPLKAILWKRLADAFAAEGLAAEDHVVFLPYMQPATYAALNDRADVYLDTIGWSGGNTTLEAVAHALPVVTLPGPFMRGRHSAAILTHIGVTETIADTEDAYVEIAVRLGTDPAWRAEVSARIAAGRDRIHTDTAPLRALEDFVEEVAVRGAAPAHSA